MNVLAKHLFEDSFHDQKSLTVLTDHYEVISNRPHGDRQNIGIEAEFPIVSLDGVFPSIKTLRTLVREIATALGFEPQILKDDDEPTSALCKATGDILSYEFSYATLEFSLSPCRNLFRIQERLTNYLEKSDAILAKHRLSLKGTGLNSSPWCKLIPHIPSPHYHAVYTYLRDFGNKNNKFFDPHFNKIICSTQTHVEIGYQDVAPCLNMINATSWIRAILFANSPRLQGQRNLIVRDSLWEGSAFNRGPESVGTQSMEYFLCDDVFLEILQRPQYMVRRDDSIFLLTNGCIGQLLRGDKITGFQIMGNGNLQAKEIIGNKDDIRHFRSYVDAAITTFGTIEIRSECQQPFNQLLAPAAFHSGLIMCVDEVNEFLSHALKGYSNRKLRNLACNYGFDMQERVDFDVFKIVGKCLDIARKGLSHRGLSEETFLNPVYINLNARQNPATVAIDNLFSATKEVSLI